MVRRWLGAALALLLGAGAAEARMHAPYRGHRIVASAAVLDLFAAPSGAYSFRKLRSAYAGNAVRIRRASDNVELDVGFAAGGDFNTAAAVAHCAATSCFVVTWYDQSGAARNLTMAAAANQPALVFACQGALPCLRTTALAQALNTAANVTPATGLVSISAVANRRVGTAGLCIWFRENGTVNRLSTSNVANAWALLPAGLTHSAVPTDAAWHAAAGVMSPVAGQSVLRIDAAEVTGTTAPTTAAGIAGIIGADTTTCDQAEVVFWDNYALTSTERTALVSNQREYYTQLPLDGFTQPSGAYSFRKLRSGYAGPALRIRRASDSAEIDVGFLGCTSFTGCPWDGAAATAHCAATTCIAVAWYDQSGLGQHLLIGGASTGVDLILNCQAGLGCLQAIGTTQFLTTASPVTPASGVVTMNTVANRSAGTGNCTLYRQNGTTGNRIVPQNAVANRWSLVGGTSGNLPANTATDAVWHSAVGIVNGASSALNIEAVAVTGTVTGDTAAGLSAAVIGGPSATCRVGEVVVWDAYALTVPEVSLLTSNQRSFWGF